MPHPGSFLELQPPVLLIPILSLVGVLGIPWPFAPTYIAEFKQCGTRNWGPRAKDLRRYLATGDVLGLISLILASVSLRGISRTAVSKYC